MQNYSYFTCAAVFPGRVSAHGTARGAQDRLRIYVLWADFRSPGKNAKRRIYCIFTCAAARSGRCVAGWKRVFHEYLRGFSRFSMFRRPTENARLLRMCGAFGLFLLAHRPEKLRFLTPRRTLRTPMRAHVMRIYGVFAEVPPRDAWRRHRFHAYLRHFGIPGAARGSRGERCSCIFTVFSRASAPRSMTPKPF